MRKQNMKNVNTMRRFILAAGAGLFALALAACDVALGSVINMRGPSVKITGPALAAGQSDITVNTLFTLRGSAEGEDDVVRMEIKLDFHDPKSNNTVRLGREWRYEGGRWQYRQDSNVDWQTYTEGEYGFFQDDDNPQQAPAWNAVPKAASGNTVDWNLPILLDPLDSGHYFFTVSAWDSPGHHDSNSSQKIKVYYVNEQPQFEVVQPSKTPALVPGKLDGTGSLRNPDVPDALKNYVYDPVNDPDGTYNSIKNWVTNPLDFQWKINDDPLRNPYKFSMLFASRDHLDIPSPGRKVYFRFPAPAGSEYQIDMDAGAFPVTDIGGGSFDAPEAGRTYMELITRLEDDAGNVQLKSHGFFGYLPEAENPWVDIKFGYKEGRSHSPTPPNAAEQFYIVSGVETPVQSWAYGKRPLDRLEWKLFRLEGNSLDPVGAGKGSPGDPWTGTVNLSDEFGSTKKGWKFTASPEFGTGRFKIEVTVYDKSDPARSGLYAAYFTIENNVTPTIRKMDANLTDNTLFGNENGIISFGGTAQIEGPNAKVDRVTIAWIKPASDTEVANRQARYFDRDYANWNKAEASGFYEDAESRVWEIKNGAGSDSIVFKTDTEGNKNGNGQEDWDFSKDINIFTGLNVGPGKGPSDRQVFLVRVLSKNALGDRSSVSTLNTVGDIEAPEVKITTLTVTFANTGIVKDYELSSLNSTDRKLPPLSVNDRISLKGTWNDNSLQAWKGLGETELHGFFKNFKVSWVGTEIKTEMPGAEFAVVREGGAVKGVWQTGEYPFTQSNPDPVVYLHAELTDLNNRRGYHGKQNEEGEQVFLETDNPTLVRISSTTSDGVYGDKKQTDPQVANSRYVDIFLEFNKAIKFFDGEGRFPASGRAPRLILNNGGRAFYHYGNQENIFRFRYFIDGKVFSDPNDPLYLETAESGLGGGSTVDGNGKAVKLNVTGIEWGDFGREKWISADGGTTPVKIPGAVYDPADSLSLSLASGKNIVIDKDPPRLESFATSASNAAPHGADSSIYITANFNETVVVRGAAPANLYLNLKGGNLEQKAAKARYSNVDGARSVSFLYTVEPGQNGADGHDTSYGPNWGAAAGAAPQVLAVKSLHLEPFSYAAPVFTITDEAGNELSHAPALPDTGKLNPGLVIDTHKPAVPVITGVTAQNYYSAQSFNITKLEGGGTARKVEYSLNYDPSQPEKASWTVVTENIDGTPGNYYINGITRAINGTYYIAARQYDDATNPNVSAFPSAAEVVGPVTIDSGDLLTGVGSGAHDGIYGPKKAEEGGPQKIYIDLSFRIPVYLPAKNSRGENQNAGNAKITLNIKNKDGIPVNNPAVLDAASVTDGNPNAMTFVYTVGDNDRADLLDVEVIDWGGLEFYDKPQDAQGNPRGTCVNTWMGLNPAKTSHQFDKQKTITILSGYPEVKKIPGQPRPEGGTYVLGTGKLAGTGGDDNPGLSDVSFYSGDGGYGLDIRFDRDISRGDTGEPLEVTQIKNDYRIPAVLSIAQWENLFWGRDAGITPPPVWSGNLPGGYENTGADYWRWIGETIYRKGSAGADADFKPDTGVKYVLNYNMNPRDGASSVSAVLPGNQTLAVSAADIQNAFRGAETLRFYNLDREVSILNDKAGKPRILRIQFAGNTALPVKGAAYLWTIPNGFVKDFLDKYNGNAASGSDASLGSGDPATGDLAAYPRILKTGGVEAPVIRINKGEDRETIIKSGVNRQAIQPLTSNARIDCRTPGSTLSYNLREATDNVGRLIFRDGDSRTAVSGGVSYALPNIGNQREGDFASFNAAKNRPQSGLAAGYPGAGGEPYRYNGGANGLNYWTPPSAWKGWTADSVNPVNFTLGSNNYNDGGMIIHIHARAAAGGQSLDSREAAYRSVFVFSNAAINNNGNIQNLGTSKEPLPGGPNGLKLGRIFIRGGDSTTGDPSVPDFPLSRDRSLWRKTRLLTPITPASFNNLTNAMAEQITEAKIPDTYNSAGQYLWFWVTWKINVNAYIDLSVGQLPDNENDAYQTPRKEKVFYYGWHRAKEHFPVIPGRTTIVETRPVNSNYADGGHGDLGMGQVLDVPARAD